jgi:cytochrome c
MPPSRPAASILLALALLLPCAAAAESETRMERGRALLAQYQCGACHTIPGVPGSRGEVATPLAAWSKRSYIAGRLVNRPDLLVRWIVAPQSLVPGTAMPSMGVSPQDAQAMAAYLFSLE